ncbi:MAG: hypothetical protein Q9161_006542 [Pseudevernia consocians]
MSPQIVVDISSDEEDNDPKSSAKTRSIGKQPTDSTRTAVQSPSRTSPTAQRPTVSAKATAGCSESHANIRPRRQSTEATATQTEQEATKDRALSAPQRAASTSVFPTTPTFTPEQEPPKPTPLDINDFRHLVSAGSIPVRDAPLIMSIQPVTPASHKRKATEALENHHLSRRPRPSPLPPTPYTGTSEHPVPLKSNNSLLWSVPAYEPPPPPSSAADPNHSHQNQNQSNVTVTTINPPASSSLKQPSIPNIHAPLAAPSISPKPTPPTTTTTTATTSHPQTPTTTPAPKPKTPRQRESKWTGAQLAHLASAIEAAFFPTVDAFAADHKKTGKQVRETFSFLVHRRIFEYSDEAADEGGKGKGKGKGKVARRFERELRADRKTAEKTMKQVHRQEATEGHWASEGMPKKGAGGTRRKKKGGGEGVLEAVVAGG